MTRDDNARFRITTWPGTPLPYPKIWLDRNRYVLLPSGGIFLDLLQNSQMREVNLEGMEIYLELLALDLRKESDILAFVNTYGPLGIRRGGRQLWWGPKDEPYAGVIYFGFREQVKHDLEDSVKSSLREIQAVMADFEFRPEEETEDEEFLPETLAEFRYGASWLRDLVRAWRWVSEDIEPKEWECSIWDASPNEEPDGPPEDKRDAAFLLEDGLDLALAPFHPRVFQPLPAHRQRRLSPSQPFGQGTPAFFLCCLELFNHIAEHATYKRCSNETCARLFVRQTGRAAHGQYRRRGVKYCSAECAKAQAQRAYRRRKAATTRQHS